MGGSFALRLRGWLEAAGLEAVEERFVDCMAGVRNPKPELVDKSINGMCDAIDALIAMAKSEFPYLLPGEQALLKVR
jgi:hypothetical protein